MTWRTLWLIKFSFLYEFLYSLKILIFNKSFVSKLCKHAVFACSSVNCTWRYFLFDMFSTGLYTSKRVIGQDWNSWWIFFHHWLYLSLVMNLKLVSTQYLDDLVDWFKFGLEEYLFFVVYNFFSINLNHRIRFKGKNF